MASHDNVVLRYNAMGFVQDWGAPNDYQVIGGVGYVPTWRLLKVHVEVRQELINNGRAWVDEGWLSYTFFWVRAWSKIRTVYDGIFGFRRFQYVRFWVETHTWNAVEGWSMAEES